MIGDDGHRKGGYGRAANDNGRAEARVQEAVTILARLLGRQIAREQSEELCAANDNPPEPETGGDRKEQ